MSVHNLFILIRKRLIKYNKFLTFAPVHLPVHFTLPWLTKKRESKIHPHWEKVVISSSPPFYQESQSLKKKKKKKWKV